MVNNKIHPDREASLEEVSTVTSQHDMELSALYEFRTPRENRTGLASGRSGELVALMFVTEVAQQLAGNMYRTR